MILEHMLRNHQQSTLQFNYQQDVPMANAAGEYTTSAAISVTRMVCYTFLSEYPLVDWDAILTQYFGQCYLLFVAVPTTRCMHVLMWPPSGHVPTDAWIPLIVQGMVEPFRNECHPTEDYSSTETEEVSVGKRQSGVVGEQPGLTNSIAIGESNGNCTNTNTTTIIGTQNIIHYIHARGKEISVSKQDINYDKADFGISNHDYYNIIQEHEEKTNVGAVQPVRDGFKWFKRVIEKQIIAGGRDQGPESSDCAKNIPTNFACSKLIDLSEVLVEYRVVVIQIFGFIEDIAKIKPEVLNEVEDYIIDCTDKSCILLEVSMNETRKLARNNKYKCDLSEISEKRHKLGVIRICHNVLEIAKTDPNSLKSIRQWVQQCFRNENSNDDISLAQGRMNRTNHADNTTKEEKQADGLAQIQECQHDENHDSKCN